MWKPDVCLYHFPCDDGFAAAWAVRKAWPDVVLKGTNYGQPFPDVDITGKKVLIADFSYKPDVLTEMAAKATSIVILDHHKTAEADLKDVNRIVHGDWNNVQRCLDHVSGPGTNVIAEFDMNQSGAMLAWRFCFPSSPWPRLIEHIQDRDLWAMKLEGTRSVSLLLRSYPYDFEVWDRLMKAFEPDTEIAGMWLEANAIERFYDQKLAEMLPTAEIKSIGKWHGVPVAHAPYAFASDLAHELLQAHKDAPFAAVVVDAYGGRTYSLRSDDSRQDVSEVARMFGGGGHRNAAGFRMPA